MMENEVRDYTEMFEAIEKRMFVIGTISSMAAAELKSCCFTDEQKIKYIAEELDIMASAMDMMKTILNENR